MGHRKMPGLIKRGETWHIDKQVGGRRLCESTGTSDVSKAQEVLAKRINEIREARQFGLRLERTFRAAATKFLQENTHKRTLSQDAAHLKAFDPFIGSLTLKQVHMGSLQEFIAKRKADGASAKTINLALSVVRRILNLAASEWLDDRGLSWLDVAPRIKLLPLIGARKPYPLSVHEQAVLFQELPDHLAAMALFKVNTGCREQEVCGLKWEFEVRVEELETSVFIIPGERVKNGEERLVVLNRVAQSIVDAQRGRHDEFVFVHRFGDGSVKRVAKMNNTAWKKARERAANKWVVQTGEVAADGFRRVRVHDLKHTFGRRLRAAGVSFEDRQDLLGHRSARITTHYSAAELRNLIDAANKVCDEESRKSPAITWLRRRAS